MSLSARWAIGVSVGLLPLIGIAAAVTFFFRAPYNPGFVVLIIPILILIGRPADEQIATFSVGGLAVSFIAHAALAEAWIRRTRPNVHPGTVVPSGLAGRPDGSPGPVRADDMSPQ